MEILDKKEQRSKRITKYILIAVSVFFAVTMLIIPLAAVIVNSLREGVSFYFKALSTKYVLSALIVTLIATVLAVLVNTVFGIIASYLLTKFSFKGKNVLSTLIDIPFSISPVIAGLAFIMTFGRGFTFIGNQVHFDKLGHDHWIDLLFYNRDLRRTVVFELKRGNFKVAYLAQLSSYLRILNDDDRREGEEAPIGIILCKKADKAYVEYIMQDFRQPMGVATYKTADEMEPELLKVLPPKEELQRIFEESGNKDGDEEGSED